MDPSLKRKRRLFAYASGSNLFFADHFGIMRSRFLERTFQISKQERGFFQLLNNMYVFAVNIWNAGPYRSLLSWFFRIGRTITHKEDAIQAQLFDSARDHRMDEEVRRKFDREWWEKAFRAMPKWAQILDLRPIVSGQENRFVSQWIEKHLDRFNGMLMSGPEIADELAREIGHFDWGSKNGRCRATS